MKTLFNKIYAKYGKKAIYIAIAYVAIKWTIILTVGSYLYTYFKK